MCLCKNYWRKCVRLAVSIFLVGASALATRAQVVFSPPKNISNSSGNTQSQQIAVDAQGNVNLVWADNLLGNYAIFYSRSPDAGNTFSTPRSISKHAQSTASGPRIAVDSAGNVSVVWTESSPDGSANFIYFSHSSDGATFTNPHNISGDAGAATSPQMAVEANGNVNILWVDTSLGNSEVFFSRSTDGGATFSAPLNVSNDTHVTLGPQIAVDPSGNINVAWEENTIGTPNNPENDVFFSRSTDRGASFSTPLTVTHSAFYSFARFPLQVAAGSNGNIDLLWENIGTGGYAQASFARSTDGGATFSQTGGAGYSSSGMMAIDASGVEIGIVGSNDIDNGEPAVNFRFSADAGATFPHFGGTAPLSNPPFFIVADAIDRFDSIYTARGGFEEETPCLCFIQFREGQVSLQQTITSQAPVGLAVMALDSGGNVYVAWPQSGTGGNADVFFSRGAVPPFSLSLSPTFVVGGFDSSTGTARLIAPAPSGGAIISLSSSNPSVASVPATVTVPEGASSATFTISTSQVTSYTTATITASYNGTNTERLTVAPLFQLSIFGNTTGGNTAGGSIALNKPAPTGGLVVALSSSDPSVASVPASVTVPAGSWFATFNIPTTPVPAPTTVEITGTSNGLTGSTSFTVQPARLQQFSVSPSTATGGASSTGTVFLDGPAPGGGALISLSSSDPSATVPASLTIPAGSRSASFTITTNPRSAPTNVTIWASYNGATFTATLTVQPLILQPFAGTSIGGGGTAGLFICMNVPVPSATVVSISSSDPSIASVPASVTVPQGPECASFNINTSPVSANTDVTISETFNGVTRTATLTVQPIMLQVLTGRGDVVTGSSALGTVVLNGPAPAGGIVVSLTSSNPSVASVPATVTIPQGSQAQNFTITGGPITAQTNVTITASYQGVTRSETIVVHF